MHIFPHWHAWHHIGCIQHTLPLLFDDCLTILEKLDALWCKLNDLITDYDEFKSDFEQWKGEVEDTIDDIIAELGKLDARIDSLEGRMDAAETAISNLQTTVQQLRTDLTALQTTVTNLGNRLTTVEGNISSIQTSISNMSDLIGNLGLDLAMLSSRVTALEQLLNNLNIIVPEELFKENDIDWFITNVSTPWLLRMGLSPATYTPLRKIVPVATDVGTIPAVSFKVGVLGFPIVQAKIPLMYSFTPGSNITDEASFYANIRSDATMQAFVKAVQDKANSAEAFANITLYNAPTFNAGDDIKFQGNYAIFAQPGSTSKCVGVEYWADNTYKPIFTSNCQVGVRVALTQGSASAYLAVAVDKVCCYYCSIDNKVYIMLLSEHQ